MQGPQDGLTVSHLTLRFLQFRQAVPRLLTLLLDDDVVEDILYKQPETAIRCQ
jgi:hypothetical protein